MSSELRENEYDILLSGLRDPAWIVRRTFLKNMREDYCQRGAACTDPSVQTTILALSEDPKWEVRLETARFARYLPSELAETIESKLADDCNRTVADAASKSAKERKKVARAADRVTEFFLTRTAQTRESASPDEKVLLADTLTRLMRQGVKVMDSGAKGVSLLKAAMYFTDGNEESGKETLKRWRNRRGVCKPPVMGIGEMKRELHLPEDIVDYVVQAEPGLIKDRGDFLGHLRLIGEFPQKQSPHS